MRYKILLLCLTIFFVSCATKKESIETHTIKESVSADTLVTKTKEDKYHNVVTDIDTKHTSETVITISDSTVVTVDTAGNVISKEKFRNVHKETNKENVKDVSIKDTTNIQSADTTKVVNKNVTNKGDYINQKQSVNTKSFSQNLIGFLGLCVILVILLILGVKFIRYKVKKKY